MKCFWGYVIVFGWINSNDLCVCVYSNAYQEFASTKTTTTTTQKNNE